ncbi:MAG: hypothetical protein IJN67_00475 [Oscillospiraceae bacterium]|nr:hypothetical protein [Oscillospiraceae bacterium]
MSIEMKLNALFGNREYVEKIRDLTTLDEIYAAVVAEIPELTKEELDDYLGRLSDAMAAMESGELNESDLDNVAGGAILETLAAIAGIITFCYGAGCAVGAAIKKWRNG